MYNELECRFNACKANFLHVVLFAKKTYAHHVLPHGVRRIIWQYVKWPLEQTRNALREECLDKLINNLVEVQFPKSGFRKAMSYLPLHALCCMAAWPASKQIFGGYRKYGCHPLVKSLEGPMTRLINQDCMYMYVDTAHVVNYLKAIFEISRLELLHTILHVPLPLKLTGGDWVYREAYPERPPICLSDTCNGKVVGRGVYNYDVYGWHSVTADCLVKCAKPVQPSAAQPDQSLPLNQQHNNRVYKKLRLETSDESE